MAQLPENFHTGAAGTFKVVVAVALAVFMGLTLLSTAASAAASAMGGTPEVRANAAVGRGCRGRDKRDEKEEDAVGAHEERRRPVEDSSLALTDDTLELRDNVGSSVKFSSPVVSNFTSETEAEEEDHCLKVPPGAALKDDASPPFGVFSEEEEEDISKPTICREVEKEVAGIKRRSVSPDPNIETKIRVETETEIKLVQETKREIKRLQEWHRKIGEPSPFIDLSSIVSATGPAHSSSENESLAVPRLPYADVIPRKKSVYKSLPRPPKKHQSSRVRALDSSFIEELEAIAQKAKEEKAIREKEKNEAGHSKSMDIREKENPADKISEDQQREKGESVEITNKDVGKKRKTAFFMRGSSALREGRRTTRFDAWTRSKELKKEKSLDSSKRTEETRSVSLGRTIGILRDSMRRKKDNKTDEVSFGELLANPTSIAREPRGDPILCVSKAASDTSDTENKTESKSEDDTEEESADQDESDTEDEKSAGRLKYEIGDVESVKSEKLQLEKGSNNLISGKNRSTDVLPGKALEETREIYDIPNTEMKFQAKRSFEDMISSSLSRSGLSQNPVKSSEDGDLGISQKCDILGLLSSEFGLKTGNTLMETKSEKGYKSMTDIEDPFSTSTKARSSRSAVSEIMKVVLGVKPCEEASENTSNVCVGNPCVYKATMLGKQTTDNYKDTSLLGPPLSESITKSWRDILKDSTEDLLKYTKKEVKKSSKEWQPSGSRLVDTERDDSDKDDSGSLSLLQSEESVKHSTKQREEKDGTKEIRSIREEDHEENVDDLKEGGDNEEEGRKSVPQGGKKAAEGETGARVETCAVERVSVRPCFTQEATVHKHESETEDINVKSHEEPKPQEIKETSKEKEEIHQEDTEKLIKKIEKPHDKESIDKNSANEVENAGKDQNEGGLNKGEDKESKDVRVHEENLEGDKAKLDESKDVNEARRERMVEEGPRASEKHLEDRSEDYSKDISSESSLRQTTMSSVRSAFTERTQESFKSGMFRGKAVRSVDGSIGRHNAGRTIDPQHKSRIPLRYGDLTSDVSGDLTLERSGPLTVDRSGDRSEENYDSSTERRPVARAGPRSRLLSSDRSRQVSTEVLGDSCMERLTKPSSRRSTDHSGFTSREVSQDNLRGASRSTNRSRSMNPSRVRRSGDYCVASGESAKVKAARAMAMRAAQAQAAAASRMAARAAAARAETGAQKPATGTKSPGQAAPASGRRGGPGVVVKAGGGGAASNARVLRVAAGPGRAASPTLNVRKEGLRRPLHAKVHRTTGTGHRSKESQSRTTAPSKQIPELKKVEERKSSLLELVAAAHSHAVATKAAMSRANEEASAK